MKKREFRWLKGDKWMSFMGGEPFKVPAKHWFMRRRCGKMPLWKYIQWKRQQVIQSELNQIPGNFPSDFQVFWKAPDETDRSLAEIMKPFQDQLSDSYNRFSDLIRNAKPNRYPNDKTERRNDAQS